MLFLYRYFCGIVEAEFFGVYPEKVLNLCAKNGISIWSAKYKKEKICCKLLAGDFKALRKILRKSGIRTHIKRKTGFPFVVSKYRKRYGILVGTIGFLVFLQIMSGYIWIIDVVGNEKTSEKEIISICKEIGITQGVKKSKISPKSDVQEILLKTDKLAWGSLNIEGCKLTVNISEIKENNQDENVPTNLKAAEDGIVKQINVTSGNCLVKVGDTVKKGDVLVAGITENLNSTKWVHSAGNIIAQTQNEISLKENFEKTEYFPSGKIKTRKAVDLFGLKIPLYLGKESGLYKTKNKIRQIKLFSQKIPIVIYEKDYIFQKKSTVTYSYEETVKSLRNKAKKKYGDEIKNEKFIQTDDGLIMEAVVIAEKNIAVSENLIISIGK